MNGTARTNRHIQHDTSMKRRNRTAALWSVGTLAMAGACPAATVATWTFNSTGSGTTAERLEVALGATNVAGGLTVSRLFVNASHDFAGFNNVPGTVNDGYGFGGNASQQVLFIHRAEYFNTSTTPVPRPEGRVTTWGNPANTAGVDTSVANAPLSFTITTDPLTTVTLNHLLVEGTGQGAQYLVHVQEAGAASVGSPAASTVSMTVPLASPVVIAAGSSKTITINLNSGNVNSAHIFNTVTLDGTVSAVPEPAVAVLVVPLAALVLGGRRRVRGGLPGTRG